VPLSSAILAREFPPPHDLASVQLAIQALGIPVQVRALGVADLQAHDQPCFALVREVPDPDAKATVPQGSIEAADRPGPQELVRIRKFAPDTVVIRGPGQSADTAVTPARFEAIYSGHVLEIPEQPQQPDRPQAEDAQPQEFGLRWFGREMRRYPGVWRDVLLAGLAVQLLALLVPLLTQVIIDKVIVHRTLNTLLVVGCALLTGTAFTALLGWVRQYLILHTGTRIDAVLAARVFGHLLRLPARYFEHRATGTLVARLHGIETIREFITGAALTLVLDLPFMLVFAAIMFYYSPLLTWIALAVLSMLVLGSLAVTPVLRRRINRQFLAGARQQAFVTEYLASIETVKSLQLEAQLGSRFQTLVADYLATGFAARQLANTFSTCAHALEQLLSITLLCVGAWLVISGESLTIGALIAFQMFASRLTAPMLRIAGLWQEFQQVEVAVRRLADIMDVPTEPVALTPARGGKPEGRLQCRNVGFRYGNDRALLFGGLSFSVRPGMCVALIGPSGSGKSTLARILQGFYLACEGSIQLDGVDIRDMAANELRSYLGVVPQETRLFSGSLLQNLLDSNPSASFAEVVAACELAQVHSVIEALPAGYMTRIGENGIGLSGGQKQRLAIARALLKRPRILIFDEATASLDAELADAVIETVNALRPQVGVLFIAHELPAHLQCDRIVRLDTRPNAGDAI